jgi:outer membrane protein assembly factor BamB
MRFAFVFLVCGLCCFCGGQPTDAKLGTLIEFDSLDGLRLNMNVRGFPGTLQVVEEGGVPCVELRAANTNPEGKGTQYYSILCTFPEALDIEKAAIQFDARSLDPDSTVPFYVRMFNQGERQSAWSFSSWDNTLTTDWTEFHFQREMNRNDMLWERRVVSGKAADKVGSIEIIIGTRQYGKPVSLQVRKLRLVKAEAVEFLDEMVDYPRRIQETALVKDGKALSRIVHPDTEAGRQAAQRIADSIRSLTGCAVPCQAGELDSFKDGVQGTNTILLGNLNDNLAVRLLYARKLTLVDSVLPGAGGYLLHSIHNPLGDGCNVIMVGASDEQGLTLATDRFCELVAGEGQGKDLVLGRVHQVKLDAEMSNRFRSVLKPYPQDYVAAGLRRGQERLDRGTHTSIAGQLAGLGERYLIGNNPLEAKLFVELWRLYLQSAVDDPRKYGGVWGFDSDFPSISVVSSWDILEEEPSLTDAERAFVFGAMMKWMDATVYAKCSGGRPGRVTHNHGTFSAMGTARCALYLKANFPKLYQHRAYEKRSDKIFREQARHSKPMEDCNGYQWLTLHHTLQYAMMKPDYTIFNNGVADKIVEFCIGNMDNHGIQVPYGDTGPWTCWKSERVCLNIIALATGNQDARWANDYKLKMRRSKPPVGDYYQPLQPGDKAPTSFDGVRKFPVIEGFYNTFNEGEWRPELKDCVDKIVFREALEPNALFLLLDGVTTGTHKHEDGNSISRLSQFDRIWLADNDYFKAPLKYHNSLAVLANGESGRLPDYVQCILVDENASYGVSVTEFREYARADWRRAVLWLKEQKCVLVLDRVTAREDANYQMRQFWHGVGDATLDADGVLLRQKGPSMRIQLARGTRLSLIDDAELGSNWKGYPHAEPVVRTLTSLAEVDLKAGESYLFATLFHGNAAGDEPAWKLERLFDDWGVMLDDGRRQLAIALDGFAGDKSRGCVVIKEARGKQHAFGEASGVTAPAHAAEASFVPSWSAFGDKAPRCLKVDSARQAASDLPSLQTLWCVTPKPGSLVLSGNAVSAGVVPGFSTMSCTPDKLGENVLTSGSNRVEGLVDGSLAHGNDNVMFPVDAVVEIVFAFKERCRLDSVVWGQWHATTSSKGTSYLLDQVEIELSDDGFTSDVRLVHSYVENRKLPNWGSPIEYRVELDGKLATGLRMRLRPRAGSAIYLSEVVVLGGGVEAEHVTGLQISAVATSRGAGGKEVILVGAASGELIALDQGGKTLWIKQMVTAVNDIAAVDVDKDGIDEIALAMKSGEVILLKENGDEIWRYQMEFYRRPPDGNLIRTGDLDGDGWPEIVCGAENWRFYAFDRKGNCLWHYESVHPSRSGAVVDLDGDGKAEVICGTHYYSMSVVDDSGKRKWAGNFGPICWAIDTAVGGDGKRSVLAGSGNGHFYCFSSTGQKRFEFNTGEEVRCVLGKDLDGDGIDEALAGSFSQFVYCWGLEDGALRWARNVGSPVNALVAGGKECVFAGLRDGRIVEIDAAGKPIRELDTKSQVTTLKPASQGVLAATEDGRLRLIR